MSIFMIWVLRAFSLQGIGSCKNFLGIGSGKTLWEFSTRKLYLKWKCLKQVLNRIKIECC